MWGFASIIFAILLLFSLYTFALTQDFDEVAQFLGRFVSESGLEFVLLILAMAGLSTALKWRYAVVAYLERLKDPTWTDSPKLVKWWTKAQKDFLKRYERATGLYRHALIATILVIGLVYVVLAGAAILLAAWYLGFFSPSS